MTLVFCLSRKSLIRFLAIFLVLSLIFFIYLIVNNLWFTYLLFYYCFLSPYLLINGILLKMTQITSLRIFFPMIFIIVKSVEGYFLSNSCKIFGFKEKMFTSKICIFYLKLRSTRFALYSCVTTESRTTKLGS